jgi:hypothetical protein
VIAKQSREGWFQSRAKLQDVRSGTTPALRATPPDSGGEFAPTSFELIHYPQFADDTLDTSWNTSI